MHSAITVEHLSKSYRLGQIGTGTLTNDLRLYWAKLLGRPNPFLKIGQEDYGNRDGEEIWALQDVSFTVEQGEVLGIIGRNGAGKSTLLKILSRVTAPTSGCVKVRGRIASLLEVGTGFHPDLTGRENIYLNGAILGMSNEEVRRKFDEIVAFAEVEKFVDTPVKRYSSGMYVRLAFAVAAHLEPEILLVDEVLAVGDAEFQKKCLGKMGDVAREGRTVLFVSHNMAAVQNLCTNGLLLSHGTIDSLSRIEDVISDYLNKGIFNSSTTNLFDSEEIQMININIYQSKNKTYGFVTDKPLYIEYEYYLKKEKITGLRIGFDVLTTDGIVIFRTFDDDVESRPVRKFGYYKSICTIPPNFFSGCDYYISPRIGIHNVKWISNNDFKIRVGFDHISGVNRVYADRRPGIIMPELSWNVKSNEML